MSISKAKDKEVLMAHSRQIYHIIFFVHRLLLSFLPMISVTKISRCSDASTVTCDVAGFG
ncbi:MAG: hypothetical protein IPN86_04900 [Saprospiraceae bacterium]|nr:hypothetical protein [Saprospiraceae bacterium]